MSTNIDCQTSNLIILNEYRNPVFDYCIYDALKLNETSQPYLSVKSQYLIVDTVFNSKGIINTILNILFSGDPTTTTSTTSLPPLNAEPNIPESPSNYNCI